MLEFIKAESNDEHINSIYKILYDCGQDMYKNKGLTHWKKPYLPEWIERDISQKDVFLAKYDEKFVATFSLTTQDSWVYLSKLAVSPEFSGKGLGRQCMAYIEDYAIKKGINLVKLDVYDNSEGAIAFYKNLGYVVTGEKPTTNFNVLLMEKHLEV